MRRHLLGMFAATALVASINPALAQDASEAAVAGAGTVLDPITVYATLSPIESFDYPGQVSVIDSERLVSLQPSSIGDVLQGVPGVTVDGGPRRSGQVPAIRGFTDEDVLLLVDGVRQSFVSGHDGRLFIDPSLLKQAEVVRGPISSLYGSGALGGVIALTTVDAKDFLDPGETAGVQVRTGFQSANEEFFITTTAFTRSKDGRFDIVGSLTYRDTGDIELGNGVTLPDDHEIASGMLKGTVELSPGLSLSTSWIRYRDDAVTPENPQGNRIPGIPDDDGLIPVDVFRKVQSDTVQATLAYKPDGNPYVDGKIQTYWTRTEVEKDEVDTTRIVSREVETIGIKADNRSRFDLSDNTKLTLTYGAEIYRDEQVGKDNTTANGLWPGVPGATANFAGVFTQAEFKFLSPAGLPGELTVLPGVRFDSFSSDTDGFASNEDTAVSPKLGLSYKPVGWLNLFGNYGEAFRAPSFNELYADGVHFPLGPGRNNVFIANPDLKPQDGATIEGGIGLEFKDVASAGDSFRVKGSYWKSKVENFIDIEVLGFSDGGCFDPFPSTPCTSQFYNVGHAELDGFELEARYDNGRFYGIATYATIDGRDLDNGAFLGILQPNKFYLDLGVKFPEYWTRVGTRLTWAGDFTKVDDASEARDSYNTVGLYASIEPGEGALKGFRLDLARAG
jgi:hemoglobin/transferrin/lactoferrin receptor protein